MPLRAPCPVIAVAVSACAQQAPDVTSFGLQDAPAVRANLSAYMNADPTADPDAFFSQFAQDVHWIYNDNEPWVGLDGLRGVEWCGTVSAEITADRVEGSGDLAYARGTYQLSLNCGDASTVDTEGVFLSTHRRQADGSWRIESLLQMARNS